MNHAKSIETETAAITISDAEAPENEYQPMTESPTFHYFLKLPAEIRSQIYKYVASTAYRKVGGLNLFKTSKQIRNAGAKVSARHCTFIVWFGWWDFGFGPSTKTLGAKATPLIQKVTIDIMLKGVECGSTPKPFDSKQIEYFGGSDVMRDSCRIALHYGKTGYVSKDCASTTMFQVIRKLAKFRILTIHIVSEKYRRIVSTEDGRIMTLRNIPHGYVYAERVKAALEPVLGPAKWRRITLGPRAIRGESQELIFRPFGWKPERCASINIWTWREVSSRKTCVWV